MRFRLLIPGLCALGLCLGCDDQGTTPQSGQPSLRVGGGGECGVTLPIPTREEFLAGSFRTAAITVSGTDPGASNMEIRNGTEVSILQTSNNPDAPQIVAFASAFDQARQEVNVIEAVGQSVGSKSVSFVGGVAQDRVFCVSGGTAIIEANIASYAGGGGFVGAVRTPDEQRFQIRCVSAEVYEQQCGNAVPPDMMAPPVDAAVDTGTDDGGVGDVAVPPALWSIQFVPPEDPQTLVIGIRNSGLGQRDNAELGFVVAELDVPLGGVLVKFFLDDITQPGVTISGGAASLLEENSEVVVQTGPDGSARVRLIAGGTPGLAAVRAVALRYDAADLRGCMATDYNCLFEAYCGRNLSRIDAAPECEQNRSQVVTIEAGIPSGRGMQLICAPNVTHAFTVRERVRGLGRWLLGDKPGSSCTLQLADRVNGRIKPGTQVFFLTEAGTVNQAAGVDEDGRASTVLRVGQPPPKDVDAIEYEITEGFSRSGHNPRDGLVRVVAFTRGEEDFVDADGDKIFNEANGDFQEPGHDLPEPFLDVNDNGTWDENEEFRDANNNRIWDDANGLWDASTEVWVSDTVLWVGDLFSCIDDDNLSASSPDCEAIIPMARQLKPVTFRCGDGCSVNQAFNALCPPSSFYLDPGEGGSIQVVAQPIDINGNCVNGGFEVVAGDDVALLGPILGPVKCFASFERPISEATVTDVVDLLPASVDSFTITDVEYTVKYLDLNDQPATASFAVRVCR